MISIWGDFRRRPKQVQNEQYICLLKGEESFKLVSPIFRKHLYAGVFDNFKGDETPIDFFELNTSKYRWTRDVTFIDVDLGAGDCLYVPAFYYI